WMRRWLVLGGLARPPTRRRSRFLLRNVRAGKSPRTSRLSSRRACPSLCGRSIRSRLRGRRAGTSRRSETGAHGARPSLPPRRPHRCRYRQSHLAGPSGNAPRQEREASPARDHAPADHHAQHRGPRVSRAGRAARARSRVLGLFSAAVATVFYLAAQPLVALGDNCRCAIHETPAGLNLRHSIIRRSAGVTSAFLLGHVYSYALVFGANQILDSGGFGLLYAALLAITVLQSPTTAFTFVLGRRIASENAAGGPGQALPIGWPPGL